MSFSDTIAPIIAQFYSALVPNALQFTISLAPIALCILLANIFWGLWMAYIRGKFYNSLKYAILELRLPKDTFKSPLAMESFLNSLHNTADGSAFAVYWKGEYRPYYSLELVSIEGTIKFFIWCEDRRKAGVMSALYSQYPGVEISEAEDYTRSVHYDPKTMKLWGGEFKFTKDDPYPIKTYVDYGLDKDPKEEFKVDPMLPLLEFLGSVGPNQQVWIQIPIRAHKDDQRDPKKWFAKTDLWQDKAKDLVNELMIREEKTKATKRNEEEKFATIPRISEGEKVVIEAIERSVSKMAFDCGIRGLYFAQKEQFDTPFGIGGIIGNFKQFNSENLNGFKPNGDRWHNKFSGAPWEDFLKYRYNRESRKVLMAYKRRSYFYPPFVSKPLVLNTEELATIYHFPGSVAATPNLERVPSKKGQAPANLPI